MISKAQLKKALYRKTQCNIQHTGWPCGTCFFGVLSRKMTNQDWQALLLFRGDYKRTDLDNLPKDIGKSILKIYRECGGKDA
jgi:hypothetical protein